MASLPVEDRSVPHIHKLSPVTGEHLADIPCATPEQVAQAVAAARAAFPSWRDTPLTERLRCLSRMKEIIRRDGERFAERISEDTGKPLVDSLMTELMSIPLFLDYYAKIAPKTLTRKKVSTPILFFPKTSYIDHFPVGVVAVISPWNFPFQLAMVPVLSALIAGNTVVLKPSEVTPITGQIIDEIMRRTELPEGVFSLLQGDGSVGAALTSAEVDKIFFTGSVATGKRVMAAAAQRPIPVELELGGKDAMIVCHDANLRRAARAAVWGGLINCGQMCISVERIFVVDSVHDRFVALVRQELGRLKVGAPEEDADIGPLTFAPQLATVERHVKEAIELGATLVEGGHRIERAGQFYQPALLTGVTPEMEIYREETFGPVLPIIRVRDEDEAVSMANDHKFGLTATVWTSDKSRGLELASRIEAGQVMINDVVLSVGNPALPFGGVKASGFGRYHGPEGLLTFTHQRAIMMDSGRALFEPFWFPYRGKYPHMKSLFHNLLQDRLVPALATIQRLRGLSK